MRTIFILFACLSLSANAFSQNLVAYYPFNGNANDESGNAINPTYIGSGVTLTADRFGTSGRAYHFDGLINSYMRMPADLLPVTNRTISLWFNVPDVSNRPGLLAYGGNGSCGTTLFMGLNCTGTGTYFVQGHCGNNGAGYTYTTPPVNIWYHWVLTINGADQKIYINGELKSTTSSFSGSTAVTGKDLALGVITSISGTAPYTDVNVGYTNGKLDDIRIYDAAMTDAQVLQLYNAEYSGLVAYYPFNGNANDESGNGNNGTVSGATLTTDRFGNSNKAYYFNGANNFISVTDNPELFSDELTLSWWYKVPEYSGTRVVIGWVDGGNRYQQFFSNNSLAYFNGYYNSCCYFNPTYSNLTVVNQWQQVTVTYKKTNVNQSVTRLYINGELKQTDNHGAAITYQPGATFFIGKTHDGGYFNGELDDIRVYSRVLSPNEILQLADVPMMPDLLAYLPMNGNANDMSGNNHNGTVVNATATTDKYDNNNSSYQFNGNGSGTSITLANTATLDFLATPFAISTWVKFSDDTGEPKMIAGKHNCGTPTGYFIGVENNKFAFWLASGSSWSQLLTTDMYNDNKWHHIVGAYDGVNQKLYVDGIFKAGTTTSYNAPATGAPIKIGEPSGGCGGLGVFNGKIDELKIYGSALDAAQVMALYNHSKGSGNALKFDGTNSKVNVGNSGWELPAFTFETWVKPDIINHQHTLISPAGNQGLGILLDNSTSFNNTQMVRFLVSGSWTEFCTINQPADGRWHHFAMTHRADDMVEVYWDGVLIRATYSLPFTFAGSSYYLGSYNDLHTLAGSMDETRFWSTVLSEAQLRQWMNRKITPDHPNFANLVHYYNFDEQNLFQTLDSKGGNTGALVNGPASVISGAALGDGSAYDFSSATPSATLTLSTGENFTATYSSGNLDGISVYVVKDPPVNLTGTIGVGSNDHYFGVFVSGSGMPQYSAIYDYTGNSFVSPGNEPTLQLFKRDNNSSSPWTNSGATLNTSLNTLSVSGQNTEYILGSYGFGLPVTLLIFDIQKLNATTAQLTWKTVTEQNNKGFEIQRSFDGNYFIGIGFVNGAGNSDILREYSVVDIPGKTGRVFYRLNQVDFDGHSKFSNIVSVVFNKQDIIKVYPNPAQQQVTVEGIENYSRLQVLDAAGKLLKDIYTNGQYLVNIDLNGLKNGIYLLRMTNEKESQFVKLVISN